MTVNSIPSPDGKLAYIGKIIKIEPIPNADLIESATVVCGAGGRWQGVIGKGSFSLGDECVVYLQDAVLPEDCGLDFMAKSDWRVKIKRFRGAPSECLIDSKKIGGVIGDDVTHLLNVRKFYKPLPENMQGLALGNFPSFIPKTDELNFQTATHLVEYMQGKQFVATEKVDGTSCTIFRHQGHFGVCSRSLELKDGDNVYWNNCRDLDIPEGLALQLEVYGEKINKNPTGIKGSGKVAFTLYDIEKHEYINHAGLTNFCRERNIPQVKVTGEGVFNFSDDDLRRLAEGTYPNGKQQEGIVIRPISEARVNGDRVSFKVLNLLYNK